MTFTQTTTIGFLIPEEAELAAAFERTHNEKEWRKLFYAVGYVTFTRDDTFFTNNTEEEDK